MTEESDAGPGIIIIFRKSPIFYRMFLKFCYLCIHKPKTMKPRLTAKEEEIMNLIWAHEEICIRDILKLMPDPKPNYNTVATQVKFLEDKGFVKRKPIANTFLYRPAMTEKEYRSTSISSLVEKYFDNSYMSVVSQFVEEEKMNIEDLKELISMIENSRK